MSRAPLALALLLPAAAFAGETPPKPAKKQRPALNAAACGPGGPRLMARSPGGAPGADAPAVDLPSEGAACSDAVADLPDDAEVALRPETNGDAPPDAAAVAQSFKMSVKVAQLETFLKTKADENGVALEGADAAALAKMFDNSRGTGSVNDLAAGLKVTLSDPAMNAAARGTTPPPAKSAAEIAEEQKKIPKVQLPATRPAPPPPAPRDAAAPRAMAHDDAGTYPYYDPRGWTGSSPAPAPFVPQPNTQGTPAGQYGRTTPMDRNQTSGPVWEPFYKKFKECRPDCEPANFNIWRNDPGSCHSVGAAIDFFAMKCGDTVHTALQNGQVAELVTCMRGNDKGSPMFAIWHQCFKNCSPANNTSYHIDHAHFSIGCGWGRK